MNKNEEWVDQIIPAEIVMMAAFMILVAAIFIRIAGTGLACCYFARMRRQK